MRPSAPQCASVRCTWHRRNPARRCPCAPPLPCEPLPCEPLPCEYMPATSVSSTPSACRFLRLTGVWTKPRVDHLRSTDLTTIWLETFGISLAFTFLVADIVVIIVRNNLSCTKAILATRRYQIIEKFVVAPAVGIYKMFEGMLCKLLC